MKPKTIKEEPKQQNNKIWLRDIGAYCGWNTWSQEHKQNTNMQKAHFVHRTQKLINNPQSPHTHENQ